MKSTKNGSFPSIAYTNPTNSAFLLKTPEPEFPHAIGNWKIESFPAFPAKTPSPVTKKVVTKPKKKKKMPEGGC